MLACIWLYMGVYGCIWLYMAVYGCIWLYMAVCGCIWLYMAIYSCSMAVNCCIWLYVPVHGCIRCSICSYCGFAACSQLVPSISCFFLSCLLISCWFFPPPGSSRHRPQFLLFPAISCHSCRFPISDFCIPFLQCPRVSC